MEAALDEAWKMITMYCSGKVTEVGYDTWFSRLKPLSMDFESGRFVIEAPNDFHRQTLIRCYGDLLSAAVKEVFGPKIEYYLTVGDEEKEASEDEDDLDELTFETFVVGPSNRFAHAACQAVASNPAMLYNPLFVYGNPGLGKTHLLNAVAREFQKNFPKRNVVYVKGEEFTNEVIKGIGNGTMPELREKYRTADLLLMDDVQFIAGKVSTQEEFFHTFETLHESNKQIILTSDRPPKEIATLEDRLKGRFECGLLADIQPPDFETRVAIIARKAASLNLDIPKNISEFIATKLKNNIRQLEGAVKKLRAFSLLEKKPINMVTAQAAISDIINNTQPTPVTVDKIIEEVSRTYGNVTPEDIRSQKRNSNISEARQISMYIIREITDLSMVDIGKTFGGRDHSTVVYAIRQVENRIDRDPHTKGIVDDIIKNIKDR